MRIMSNVSFVCAILLVLHGTAVFADLGKTLQYCCGLGRDNALSPTKCETVVRLPIRNVRSDQQNICSSTMNLCCLQYSREVACDLGKEAAKNGDVCHRELKTDQDISFKYCCEACKLGTECGLLAGSCDLSNNPFNPPWSQVFASCCQDNVTFNRMPPTFVEIFPRNGKQGFELLSNNKSSGDMVNQCSNGSQACQNREPAKNVSCYVGYKFDSKTNDCVDANECETFPCNSYEICINNIGSYKCECDVGFQRDRFTGACVDVNECQVHLHNCDINTQRCDNTIGSYYCVRSVGCGTGYTFNSQTGNCEDDDECLLETNSCKSLGSEWECRNTLGSFRCKKKDCTSRNCTLTPTLPSKLVKTCPRGFKLNELGTCTDIDECKMTSTCMGGQKCTNTIGSYYCAPVTTCSNGLKLNETTNLCMDINECEEQSGVCDHKCVNLWGSFICTCQPGFQLHQDNRSCVDVNECELFKDRRLCAGTCVNVPGSYRCQCPNGYQLSLGGAWCQDIDECELESRCHSDEICLNMRGSYRCNTIECPSNYERDKNKTNRCIRAPYYCGYDLSEECLQAPISYSFNYLNLVSNVTIPTSGFLELFNLRGSQDGFITSDFSLKVTNVRTPSGVPRVRDDFFYLHRLAGNSVTVKLKKSIIGPQDVELHLKMSLYSKGVYVGFNICKLFVYISPYDF